MTSHSRIVTQRKKTRRYLKTFDDVICDKLYTDRDGFDGVKERKVEDKQDELNMAKNGG